MIFTVDLNTIVANPRLTVTIILSALALIILAIILAVILFFTWRIRIMIEAVGDKFSFTVWIFGIPIRLWPFPKIKKKYNLRKYTLKKIKERDRKRAERQAKKKQPEQEKKSQPQKKKEKKKEKEKEKKPKDEEEKSPFYYLKKFYDAFVPAPSDTVDYLVGLIRSFFPTVLGHAHFHVARIRLSIGGPDAASTALRNTAVYTALIPALAFIERHSNLHGLKRAEIEIIPDFLSTEIKYDVKLGFSMSIGGFILIILRTVWRIVFGYLKIKPKTLSALMSQPEKTDNEAAPKNQGVTITSTQQTEKK